MNFPVNFLQFVIEFFDRIQSESPVFFKKLQWIFGILTFIMGAAKAAIDLHLWHPGHAEGISQVIGYVITGTITVFGMSHLPVKDNSLSEKAREMDGPGGVDPTDPHGTKHP